MSDNLELTQTLNPYMNRVTDSTEETFINALSSKYNISLDDARILNNKNIAEMNSSNIDMVVNYKTAKKEFIINSDISIVMGVEVQYLSNYSLTEKAIEFIEYGNPSIEIIGNDVFRWSSNIPSIDKMNNNIRISTLGRIMVDHDSNSKFDLTGFEKGVSAGDITAYYTPIDTYVMNIKFSDSSVNVY